MTDLVIIGAGLSGLFAGVLAARRGLAVTVVARGSGGLLGGTGGVDMHSYDAAGALLAAPDFAQFADTHPYAPVDRALVAAALMEFQAIASAHGLTYTGDLTRNHHLPTALGAPRATLLVPQAQAAGDLRSPEPMVLVQLAGFRDFYPDLMAANLRTAGHSVLPTLPLPLPDAPRQREAYATDLAHALDQPETRREWLKAWRNAFRDYTAQHGRPERLGFPAVLGLREHAAVLRDLETTLDVAIFEVPILPPSVPGLRLETALRAAFSAAGGRLVLGGTAAGQIDRHGTASATYTATGAARSLPARYFLLASGGFGHGGLEAKVDGQVCETTFGLPVVANHNRATWGAENYLDPQPYARFGVRVDAHGRPTDEHGEPLAHNLWACGSLLAGADRLTEGSREGIALVSAYRAVQAIDSQR